MILLFSDGNAFFSEPHVTQHITYNSRLFFIISKLQLCNRQVALVLPSRYTSATHELLNCNRLTLLGEITKRIA